MLADAPSTHTVMLSSPISMDDDYPQASPESAGALSDATEIDEILSLRWQTLTDETCEARAPGTRVVAIIDHVRLFLCEVLKHLQDSLAAVADRAVGWRAQSPACGPRCV